MKDSLNSLATSSQPSALFFSPTLQTGRPDPAAFAKRSLTALTSRQIITVHHTSIMCGGGSAVQLDPSANSLLTRKLQHLVH